MPSNPTRREFLQTTATVVTSLSLGALASPAGAADPHPPRSPKSRSVANLATRKLDGVRWGIIGLWERGLPTLADMLEIEGSEVRAICDPYGPAIEKALDEVTKSGKPKPAVFGDGPEDYRRLLERDDIDAVMICTPWRTHVPIALAALRAGKHAFVEVPAAVTVEDCWRLVEAAEETQLHCMMMENCCYGREELMLLQLCRQGVFGELLHGEAGYLHDLRGQLSEQVHGEGTWRPPEHVTRNGNLYPTHGLGPVAQYMGINRSDRFETLVSLSSPARGFADYAAKHFAEDDPRRKTVWACGDVNTSLIRTALGRTIVLQHNTSSARPYSRINQIQGTRGLFAGYPSRIYIEGTSPQEDHWETDLNSWFAKHEHPWWQEAQEAAKRTPGNRGDGHGGMDFVMRWRIMQCLRNGLPLDQSVYDAAAWSVVGPLSEQSVARGGAPVAVPDFTRGEWSKSSE
ncbi:MAG TPA: Gfo/Idh/MocA family oxidoreductase [Candidatus Didemnitutus sp.]|nr:Gfo/Idh/MocA family oxidoreductase [Candidatus Didemnitutus sp.]